MDLSTNVAEYKGDYERDRLKATNAFRLNQWERCAAWPLYVEGVEGCSKGRSHDLRRMILKLRSVEGQSMTEALAIPVFKQMNAATQVNKGGRGG